MSEEILPLFKYGKDNAKLDGSDVDDQDNARLTGQIERIYIFMLGGKWWTLDEIAYDTGDPHASVSAQLRNLRKDRFGNHTINKRRRTQGLWEYQLIPNELPF